MGTESRRPSYLNYNAMKYPGVGDYSADRGSFGKNGMTMGGRLENQIKNSPGPLDYNPSYKSIQ